jgi:hypothetical protein
LEFRISWFALLHHSITQPIAFLPMIDKSKIPIAFLPMIDKSKI